MFYLQLVTTISDCGLAGYFFSSMFKVEVHTKMKHGKALINFVLKFIIS